MTGQGQPNGSHRNVSGEGFQNVRFGSHPRLLSARRVLRQRLCGQPRLRCNTVAMTTAEIVVLVLVLVPLVLVGGVFVWAARKDGEEDRAVQARLGIRRRTRLGR